MPSAEVRSILLRLAGAALLLFAVGRMFDAGQVWRIISSVTVAGVAVILTLTIISWIVGIAKWKALLGAVPVSAVSAFYFLGQLYSLILPGQLAGEAVKTARLAARGPGLGPVAASVLIDRLTSLVGLGVVSGVGLWWAGHRGPTFTALAWLIWLLTGAFTLLLFAMRWSALQRRATRGTALLRRRGGRWRKPATVLRRFVHGWAAYGREAKLVATTFVLAIAFQLANVAIVTSIAANLHVALPFSDAAWLVGLISIVTLLPVSFGGVGVREAGFVGLLSMIGVPGAQALSVSLICSLIVVLAAAVGLLVELHWIKALQPISGGR
jgi:uncharacterized protein (TIRG00374 family)